MPLLSTLKKSLQLVLLLVISTAVSAQQSIYDLMNRTDLRLQDAELIANRYFDSVGTGRGTGYKHFQRWLYERKFHIDENGNYITPQTEWSNFLQASTR